MKESSRSVDAAASLDDFRRFLRSEGTRLYRDFIWRDTSDPYVIWLSEVMLQQTQTSRVEKRLPEWLDRFPTIEILAASSTSDVLSQWQGMGYNRRALALKAAAETIVRDYDGVMPRGTQELVALPGIGPATAQGIRSFAYGLPGVYLETNVRSVILYHFFPDALKVPDKQLIPIIFDTCPSYIDQRDAESDPDEKVRRSGKCVASHRGYLGKFAALQDEADTPRAWYYAMLDYGSYLKASMPNPSRRSGAYTKQSAFEGSHRQKRSVVVRALLSAQQDSVFVEESSLTFSTVCKILNDFEASKGRPEVKPEVVEKILDELVQEGFCEKNEYGWEIVS